MSKMCIITPNPDPSPIECLANINNVPRAAAETASQPGLRTPVPRTFSSFDDTQRQTGGLYVYAIYDFAVIEAVWVAPEFQRQGIGYALYREAEKFAKEVGCRAILASTLAFYGSMPFWEKIGFTRIATVDDCPRGSQTIYLKKSLA